MEKIRITLKKDMEDLIYKPEHKIDTYYQICKYKDPSSQLYQTRKIFFNEKGDILKTFEKEYGSNTIRRFLKEAKINKYKIYPTNNISYIDVPNKSDMTQAQSSLINQKAPNYGWLDNGWSNNEFIGSPLK